MSKRISKWYDLFTSQDEGLSILLLLLIVFIFVIYPLQIMGITNLVLVRIFFSLLVVAGVWSVARRKTHLVVAAFIALANLIFQWYRAVSDAEWVLFANLAITIFFEGFLIVFILMRTFAKGPVNSYRIQGSVVVYLLIGVLFSTIYTMIYALEANAFNFSNLPATLELAQASLTYFSFVTLTTIGYGDIQPLHPFSQAAATMEGLLGQLFPAILIARLVSQSLTSPSEKT
jgi:hypothetical protein